jgi:isoleucyl-tRNA synthetase
MDRLFQDLNDIGKRHKASSVHLVDFPISNSKIIDKDLERRMSLAQNITTLSLSLRKKEKIRVRQPLKKIMIPIVNANTKNDISSVSEIIKSELNIKEIQFLEKDASILKKQIKPNFKTLGPKFGKKMKLISNKISEFSSQDIIEIEKNNYFHISDDITISLNDVEIISADIPGFSVAKNDEITVALDITLTEALLEEGLAREFVNKIQALRKNSGYEVTDQVKISVEKNDLFTLAIKNNFAYICEETLAAELNYEEFNIKDSIKVELIDHLSINISLEKN